MTSEAHLISTKTTGFLGLEAPRYTSYPTAHHFATYVGATSHRRWLSEISTDSTISIYIHIPFCKELCWFCGCHTKMTKRYKPVNEYVQILLREIALVGITCRDRGKLVNVHFGGGSPSMLLPSDWQKIILALKDAFGTFPEGELAIELDPRTTTTEAIASYSEMRCNRVSLGIQDFNPKVQEAINRIQDFEMVQAVVADLRKNDIHHLNCDLIYGLPHQSQEYLNNTLEKTLSLDPDRISIFSYAHMPELKKHQKLIDAASLPSLSEKLDLYLLASQKLEENGYVMIGIDHFAKADDSLTKAMRSRQMRRNFQGYVDRDTDVLVGIGSSAISQFPQGYTQNHPSNPLYTLRVQNHDFASARGWRYQKDDILRKRIIDELMCFMDVDLMAISEEFAVPVEMFSSEINALKKFETDGIISINNWHIRILTPYRMAARVIATEFDAYRSAQKAKYSKVV